MRKKFLVIMLVALGVAAMFSCDKEDLFDQPSINVIGFSLDGLPGEYTTLNVDIQVINNDSKEATIKDAEYQVTIDGFVCENESVVIGQKIYNDVPLDLTLPLTLKTTDAIQLLSKLDAGQELSYTVDGTFHLDKAVLDAIDLPIDIEGTASVDVGFEDFFEQPKVTVNNMTGTYSINGLTSYTFDFDVNCTVKNMDSRDVIVDEVEYIVNVEDVESNTHWYSDSYSTDIAINGGQLVSMTLPVTLNVGVTVGAALADVMDGYADYIVEGTFHVIEVDGVAADFLLPLYVTGMVPVTMVGP